MCARNYSLRCTLHANATIPAVLSANRKLSTNGLREMSQLNVSIGADLREEDFWTTSRLVRRQPPMRSNVRLRITSGLPVRTKPLARRTLPRR